MMFEFLKMWLLELKTHLPTGGSSNKDIGLIFA